MWCYIVELGLGIKPSLDRSNYSSGINYCFNNIKKEVVKMSDSTKNVFLSKNEAIALESFIFDQGAKSLISIKNDVIKENDKEFYHDIVTM